jgi:hypothetical protein
METAKRTSLDEDITTPVKKSPKSYAFTLWFLFLSALAGIAAHYRMLTGFSYWDDEGALMVTVKQYLGGLKLYNQISVGYGPVYYFYNWALRTLTATAVTHDVVRMSSLLPWLLSAFVSAWIVFRLTDSLVLSSAAHLLVFSTLCFFCNEPGHPQELCILLLVCLPAAGILVSIPRCHLSGIILLGMLVAALVLIKVNIGTFAFLATSLAIVAHSPKTKLSRLAFIALGVACVSVPAVLMKAHLGDPSARLFAVLVTVSMMAVLLVLFRMPRSCCFPFRDSLVTSIAFVLTFTAIVLVLKAQGISLTRVLHALLLDSLSHYVFRGSWYIPIPFARGWYFCIVSGLLMAGYLSYSALKREGMESYLAVLKLVLAFLTVVLLLCEVLLMLFFSKFGPSQLVPPFLFFVLPPFCWLVLYGPPDEDSKPQTFPRTLLCIVTVLQTLYAYPIAGSQFVFVQVLPVIVAMICLSDYLAWQQKRMGSLSPILMGAATPVLLLCVATSYVAIARIVIKRYDSLPSLQLPGSVRIHVEEAQARDYRWLVRELDDHCDIFVGLPELPSLHVWTGKDPLEGMEMDDWMLDTSDQQQLALATVLSGHPNACAIYNPDLVRFWDPKGEMEPASPLARYLFANFKVVGRTGQFSFLVRNERNLTVESAP